MKMTAQIIGCSLLIAAGVAIIVYTLVRKSPVRPTSEEGKTPEQIAAEEAAEDFRE
jgi:hypothetical protein